MAAGLDAMQDITSEAGPSQSQLTQEVTVDTEELEMNGETADDGQAPKLSKSAMKKAARKAKEAEMRPLKRQAERERKRERLEQQRQAYAAGEMTEEEKQIFEQQRSNKHKRAALRKRTAEGKDGFEGTWKGGVVMDMGFDELMTESEISSIHSQLSYCYSTNRAASPSISAVLHTSFNGRLRARMDGQGGSQGVHRKWSRCHWWEAGVEDLLKERQPAKTEESTADAAQTDSLTAIEAAIAGRREDGVTHVSPFPKTHKLIYLSADSPNELTTLSENEIYIIGGIVDKNRHKNLCQGKAEKLGIETARLPIGTFLADMPTRKVLTVNHVFEILLEYIAKQDWKQAFDAVMPARKLRASEETKKAKWNQTRKAKLAESGTASGLDVNGDMDGDEAERPRKRSRDEVGVEEENKTMNETEQGKDESPQ